MNEGRYRQHEQRIWAQAGITPTDHTVELQRIGTRLRVQEVGSGPPVVFIHGASNGGTSWSGLVAQMPGYRCLLIDRPGCGLSPSHGGRFRDRDELAHFAGDLVLDVFDAFELERPFLLGTSYGGHLVLRAAASHGDRIEKLVTLGWSIGAPIEYTPFSMRMGSIPGIGALMFRLPASKGMVRAVLKQVGLKDAFANGKITDEFIAWFRSLLNDTDTMANELRQGPPIITPLKGMNDSVLIPDDELARISVPTYMLWGRSDPMGGEAVASAFAAKVPTATLDMMPGGHAVWLDDPEHVGKALTTFLAV